MLQKKSCSCQRLSYVFSTCMTSTLWTWVLKGIFEYYFLLYCTGYRIYLQHVYIAFVELTLTILSSIFCFKNRNQQSLIMKAAMLMPALVTWYDMIWFCLCKNRQQIPRFWKRWRVVAKNHTKFWNLYIYIYSSTLFCLDVCSLRLWYSVQRATLNSMAQQSTSTCTWIMLPNKNNWPWYNSWVNVHVDNCQLIMQCDTRFNVQARDASAWWKLIARLLVYAQWNPLCTHVHTQQH